ncbi:MAG: hypothetical protein LWW79_05560 [Holophagaceae bacterium]|nr:hypothetical protein [Holophagaceae bacterium]
MTHLCAWCQLPTPLDGPEAAAAQGLCPACLEAVARQQGTEILAWIEEVPHPAVAVDQEVRIRAANQPACELLQTDWVALLGRPLCEVLGCEVSHACRAPESRGATHCLVDRTSLRAGEVVALRLDRLVRSA